jgi:hypothetical protein
MGIKNVSALKSAIIELETKSNNKKTLLNKQFYETCESLKPRNILNSAVTNFTGSSKLSGQLVSTASSLAVSFFLKKFLFGKSPKWASKIGGMIFASGIKRLVEKYSDEIKSNVVNLFKRLIAKFTH